MAWYGRPMLAYIIFLPAAAAGLLAPYLVAPPRPGGATPLGRSLGTALLFAAICSALTSVGMHSSFLYALWAAAAAASAALLGVGASAVAGWGGAAALAAIYAAPVAVALPSAVTFMAHVMEKVGLAGAAPGALGLLLADAAVGAVAGATLVLTFGTLTPLLAAALGRRRAAMLVVAALTLSAGAAAWASREFSLPYSAEHPKRLLVQHIHLHGPGWSLWCGGAESFFCGPAEPAGWGRRAEGRRCGRRGCSASGARHAPRQAASARLSGSAASCAAAARHQRTRALPRASPAGGAVVDSKLSVVGLDSFPLVPALPPSFASLPPADFSVQEWEVGGRPAGSSLCSSAPRSCSACHVPLHVPAAISCLLCCTARPHPPDAACCCVSAWVNKRPLVSGQRYVCVAFPGISAPRQLS